MKQNIHPKYSQTSYSCACGNEFKLNSTHDNSVRLDICYKCHPLFTGKEKLVDSEGQIEKFRKKYQHPVKATKKSANKTSVKKSSKKVK